MRSASLLSHAPQSLRVLSSLKKIMFEEGCLRNCEKSSCQYYFLHTLFLLLTSTNVSFLLYLAFKENTLRQLMKSSSKTVKIRCQYSFYK